MFALLLLLVTAAATAEAEAAATNTTTSTTTSVAPFVAQVSAVANATTASETEGPALQLTADTSSQGEACTGACVLLASSLAPSLEGRALIKPVVKLPMASPAHFKVPLVAPDLLPGCAGVP